MLKVRVVTAIIGLSILYICLYYFSTYVPYIIVMCCGWCAYELAIMFFVKNIYLNQSLYNKYFDIFNSVVLSLSPLVICLWFNVKLYFLAVYIVFSLVFVISVLSSSDIKIIVNKILSYFFIIIYLNVSWFCVYKIYELDEISLKYLLLLLTIVWSADTGAYFIGCYFGKHKLFPTISPSKTIEGAIGAVFASIVGGTLIYVILKFDNYSLWFFVVLSIIGAFFDIIGDAVESCLKRFVYIKDSGNLFPGHGGLLDRVDGILLTAPVLLFLLTVF